MQTQKKVRVNVICSDVFSRNQIEALIMRDPRTVIPESDFHIDVVLVYGDWQTLNSSLSDIRERFPQSKIAVMVGDCTYNFIYGCVKTGVNGVFHRDDVRSAVASYIIRTNNLTPHQFALSDSFSECQDEILPCRSVVIPAWKPCPMLSERLEQTLDLRLIRGLSSAMTAETMGIQPGSVDRHLCNAYDVILYNPHIDDSDFIGLDMDSLSKDLQGYLWYTALPVNKKVIVSV